MRRRPLFVQVDSSSTREREKVLDKEFKFVQEVQHRSCKIEIVNVSNTIHKNDDQSENQTNELKSEFVGFLPMLKNFFELTQKTATCAIYTKLSIGAFCFIEMLPYLFASVTYSKNMKIFRLLIFTINAGA